MTNSRKGNGRAKVCDRSEHQATPGREARGLGVLGEVVEGCGFLLRSPVMDFCHRLFSGFNRRFVTEGSTKLPRAKRPADLEYLERLWKVVESGYGFFSQIVFRF